MTNFLNEFIFLFFNYIIIRIHARRFDKNIPINSGFHFWWGLATVAVGLILFAFTCDPLHEHDPVLWEAVLHHFNWWFALALICLRAWFYNPVLNLSRHPAKPWFYLATKDAHNSAIDKLVYSWYRVGWFIALGGWLFLQYKIYQG